MSRRHPEAIADGSAFVSVRFIGTVHPAGRLLRADNEKFKIDRSVALSSFRVLRGAQDKLSKILSLGAIRSVQGELLAAHERKGLEVRDRIKAIAGGSVKRTGIPVVVQFEFAFRYPFLLSAGAEIQMMPLLEKLFLRESKAHLLGAHRHVVVIKLDHNFASRMLPASRIMPNVHISVRLSVLSS